MQLEIERQALQKEKDKASRERLEKIEDELANLKEKSTRADIPAGKPKRQAISELSKIKEKIERTQTEIETRRTPGQSGEGRPFALWQPCPSWNKP